MNIVNRITSLRSLMKSERVDALIIYGTDPHLSEYVLDNWRSIEWISGFTGSYGRVVITHDQALLWTDSRYFLQAQTQLNDTGFVLMKDRQADSISIAGWLKRHLEPGSSVAIDGLTISAGEATKLKEELGAKGIHFTITNDLVSPVWKNRQPLPQGLVTDYPLRFAGKNRANKLLEIRNKLTDYQAEATLICQLDDLAFIYFYPIQRKRFRNSNRKGLRIYRIFLLHFCLPSPIHSPYLFLLPYLPAIASSFSLPNSWKPF